MGRKRIGKRFLGRSQQLTGLFIVANVERQLPSNSKATKQLANEYKLECRVWLIPRNLYTTNVCGS